MFAQRDALYKILRSLPLFVWSRVVEGDMVAFQPIKGTKTSIEWDKSVSQLSCHATYDNISWPKPSPNHS